MNGQIDTAGADLAGKIARLVEERGWNQEDFVRFTDLNRLTVRQIFAADGRRRLHNKTVAACAKALGLTVSELRDGPLERLLERMNRASTAESSLTPAQHYDWATQPELAAWIERNPERAAALTAYEVDELLSLQGTGGPLTSFGVQHFVDLIERKRSLVQRVQVVASTEYLDVLETFVGLLYDKVRPYADRA